MPYFLFSLQRDQTSKLYYEQRIFKIYLRNNRLGTFQERIRYFNVFLTFIVKNNFMHPNFIAFLQNNEVLPIYMGGEVD